MRVCFFLSACMIVLVGAGGCDRGQTDGGPELVQVTGTVTLDGEPVDGAHVRFSPQTSNPAAFAVTDERGRYELRTLRGNGAVPGSYRISVTKEVREKGMEFESQAEKEAYVREHGEPPEREATSILPDKYGSPRDSGLTAEVTAAKRNRFDLELEGGDENGSE